MLTLIILRWLKVELLYETLKSWVSLWNLNWFEAAPNYRESDPGTLFIKSQNMMLGSWIDVMVTRTSNERNVDMDDGELKPLILRRRDLGIYQLINYFLQKISPQNTGFWAYREKKTITVEFVPAVQTFFTIFQRWKAWMEQSPTVIESDPGWPEVIGQSEASWGSQWPMRGRETLCWHWLDMRSEKKPRR